MNWYADPHIKFLLLSMKDTELGSCLRSHEKDTAPEIAPSVGASLDFLGV